MYICKISKLTEAMCVLKTLPNLHRFQGALRSEVRAFATEKKVINWEISRGIG